MSEVEIHSGGVVAVDTDSLRLAAFGFATLRSDLDALGGQLRDAAARLDGCGPDRYDLVLRADGAARRAEGLSTSADTLAGDLKRGAAVYETAELMAERGAAVAAGDQGAIAAIDARLAALAAEHPFVELDAATRTMLWRLRAPAELLWQAAVVPYSAAQIPLVIAMIGVAGYGHGLVARGATLSGDAPPVVLRRIDGPAPTAPPRSLAGVVGHMPPDPAQVRVERYAMPDGSRRFALYVAGTKEPSVATQPWNMNSNVQLYAGQRSASYEAAKAALRAAGARQGDAVYAFGHSQGGMVAGRIAMDGEYDAKALVTFGSPQSFDVGAETLSVELRHSDDPVSALADGGHPQPVGAAGSFVAERVAHPAATFDDLSLAAHHLDAYAETARQVDAAGDVRVDRMRDVLAELDSAASVDVFDFEASQVLPPVTPSSGAGG